jgi:hypothetical protein
MQEIYGIECTKLPLCMYRWALDERALSKQSLSASHEQLTHKNDLISNSAFCKIKIYARVFLQKKRIGSEQRRNIFLGLYIALTNRPQVWITLWHATSWSDRGHLQAPGICFTEKQSQRICQKAKTLMSLIGLHEHISVFSTYLPTQGS